MRNFVYYFVQIVGFVFHFSIADPIRGDNVFAVKEGEFPLAAALIRKTECLNDECDFICTGVLISKRHILTADHCFEELQPNDTQIILNSIDLRYGTRYNVSKWITYDEWAMKKRIHIVLYDNDIAVIELSEDVDDKLVPAKLSKKSRCELKNRNVTMLGWGQRSLNSTENPRYLHKAQLQVLKIRDCQQIMLKLLNRLADIEDSYFCTRAEPFILLGHGDSGGPILTEKGKVVGVNTGICPNYFTLHPRQINKVVNLHASVHYYKKFIKDVLNGF
ncbi:chymotrypsin-2-like [Phymastichus coffea]|uniref:chymotrypsin-2-like n=1 Tax=Phymastichus coffea TaxID=108790 RepID=UPI00273C1B91|nr:chymotrypsin-2-like [Phymastichus coffea]